MTTPILTLDDVVKRFGHRMVLGDDARLVGISATFHRGEVCAVVGRNGAGKSTLLDAVSGLCVVDAGTITLNSKNITNRSPSTIARAGVARTFQFPRSFGPVHDATGGIRRRLPTNGIEKTIDFTPPRRSSISYPRPVEMRLQNLQTAIERCSGTLLLDEPLIGLDDRAVITFENLLLETRRRGWLVLWVEHDLERVRRLADRVCFLSEGHIGGIGTPTQLWNENELFRQQLLMASSIEVSVSSAHSVARPSGADANRLVVEKLTWNSPDGFELRVPHLHLGPGVHQVIGPSGAGKSALLNVLAGVLPSKAVRFEYPGSCAGGLRRGLPLHTLAKSGLRFAPEDAPQSSPLTVKDAFRLVRPRESLRRVMFCSGHRLEVVFPDLVQQSSTHGYALAGGQRQMLNLARAFLEPCRLMLLDRPLQHLARAIVSRVENVVLDAAQSCPVVLVGAEGSARINLATQSWWTCLDGLVTQRDSP